MSASTPPFEPGDLMSGAAQIGQFAGLAEHQVLNLVKAGRLPPVFRLGRKIYARRSALAAYLLAQEALAGNAGTAAES